MGWVKTAEGNEKYELAGTEQRREQSRSYTGNCAWCQAGTTLIGGTLRKLCNCLITVP